MLLPQLALFLFLAHIQRVNLGKSYLQTWGVWGPPYLLLRWVLTWPCVMLRPSWRKEDLASARLLRLRRTSRLYARTEAGRRTSSKLPSSSLIKAVKLPWDGAPSTFIFSKGEPVVDFGHTLGAELSQPSRKPRPLSTFKGARDFIGRLDKLKECWALARPLEPSSYSMDFQQGARAWASR